jgi:hypothetical protein
MRHIAFATGLAILLATGAASPAGAATLSPSSADFGTQTVGSVSAPKAFTLAPSVTDLTLAVSTTGDFSQTNDCPAVLTLLSSSCTINVTFAPTAAGGRSGTLSTAALVVGGPSATLSGTGNQSGGNGATVGQKCKKKKKGKGHKRAASSKKHKKKKCKRKKKHKKH